MKIIKEIPGAAYGESDDGKVGGTIFMGIIPDASHIAAILRDTGYKGEELATAVKEYLFGLPIVKKTEEGLLTYIKSRIIRTEGITRPLTTVLVLVPLEDYEFRIDEKGLVEGTKILRIVVPQNINKDCIRQTLDELISRFHSGIAPVPQLS